MTDEKILHEIVQLARKVHLELGPGYVESVYVRALISELKSNGFRIEREKLIKIWYGSQLVGRHRLDLLVNSEIIIELKANRGILPLHLAQIRSYLHATEYPLGLILNFGATALEWEVVPAISDEPSGMST